jgi:hypothetical protein
MNEPANRRITNPHVDRIRELNDQLRCTLTDGKIMTNGVVALGPEAQPLIVDALKHSS